MSRGTRLVAVPALTAVLFLTTNLAHAPRAASRGDGARTAATDRAVSILVYHRFGPTVADSMTIRTNTFRSQLAYLAEHHYSVVPLHSVTAYLQGEAPPPPPRAVVITADDGHESVFTEMRPLVHEFGIPVTLFIYPSAISNASYAMTWAQLEVLRDMGLFDIESHTYWHPNFAVERRRLAPDAYRTFASMQLCKSKAVLHDRLGVEPDVVAWPFGIYEDDLFQLARDCGYVAGVTLDRRLVRAHDNLMTLPRFLVTDAASGPRFAAMLPSEDPR